MFNFLYVLPDFAISAMFGLLMLFLVAILPHFLNHVFKIKHDKDSTKYAIRGQATVITFIAIVLSFCLINAQGNLRDVDAQVSQEATAINQMDRLLLRYGDKKVMEMRTLLMAYAESIVNKEWPLLIQGGHSELKYKSSPTFAPLSRAIFTINPSLGRQTEIYNQILKQIDLLSEERSQRIQAASVRLPNIFWEIVFVLFLLLVSLSLMIKPTVGRSIAIGGQGLAVALLLSLVVIYDQPFKGQTSVKSDAFINVIEIMKNRHF
jgi:hypothetical protein